MRVFRFGMVQMNPTVGDLEGNARAICRYLQEARKAKVDVVAFPELAVTGYPPEDLLLKPRFLEEAMQAVQHIVQQTMGLVAVVGCVAKEAGNRTGQRGHRCFGSGSLYNAAVIMTNRHVVGTYAKRHLPNYGFFDEQRYFSLGLEIPVFVMNGVVVGVSICEDIWHPDGPTDAQVSVGGAELILNINASPYQVGKNHLRQDMLARHGRDHQVLVSYTNMVGVQDELIFDGNSLVVNQRGEVIRRGKSFEEDLLLVEWDMDTIPRRRRNLRMGSKGQHILHSQRIVISETYCPKSRRPLQVINPMPLEPLEEVYKALVLGVHDYAGKNRFEKVVIGISGGIDSALTAVIAKDAIGASNVVGVFMPSRFTARASREDARALAKVLGIRLLTIPITKLFQAYLRHLRVVFQEAPADTTEENLQARIRGNLIMALSNKFGYLVLTTGNKSEMSVGYATLYGDMAGGFAVIKDVPKTLVCDLTQWRSQYQGNDFTPVAIPTRIQERPPSAELKADQTDQDTLPPYPMLDAILKAYVEEDRSPHDIASLGFDPMVVTQVVTMVDRSEYKRRQAPIGIKITGRAFGKDRRMPMTNRYPHT